jgi:hypothetical protein
MFAVLVAGVVLVHGRECLTPIRLQIPMRHPPTKLVGWLKLIQHKVRSPPRIPRFQMRLQRYGRTHPTFTGYIRRKAVPLRIISKISHNLPHQRNGRGNIYGYGQRFIEHKAINLRVKGQFNRGVRGERRVFLWSFCSAPSAVSFFPQAQAVRFV